MDMSKPSLSQHEKILKFDISLYIKTNLRQKNIKTQKQVLTAHPLKSQTRARDLHWANNPQTTPFPKQRT